MTQRQTDTSNDNQRDVNTRHNHGDIQTGQKTEKFSLRQIKRRHDKQTATAMETNRVIKTNKEALRQIERRNDKRRVIK